MMHYNELVPAQVPHADQLGLAVAAYLARFKDTSRDHADSDLRCYLTWCADRSLNPFLARRPHLELYIRWMQEVRRFKSSTVSRRFSVTAGFYRTCVIDGVLEHSPAEHVRRPAVPAESPTLGFTHAATRRLRRLAETAGIRIGRTHPHMLRHTFVTTMLDAGVDLRDVQIAARRADPRTTMHQVGPARTSTAIPTTSSPPTWHPAPDQISSMKRDHAENSALSNTHFYALSCMLTQVVKFGRNSLRCAVRRRRRPQRRSQIADSARVTAEAPGATVDAPTAQFCSFSTRPDQRPRARWGIAQRCGWRRGVPYQPQ
jgi:hypothetical protein